MSTHNPQDPRLSTPVEPHQQAQHYLPPQQPQLAPQASQPQPELQQPHVEPRYAQPLPSSPQTEWRPSLQSGETAPLNVLAIVAVILLALDACSELFMPFVYRSVMYDGIMSMNSVLRIVFVLNSLVIIGLAIGAILTKRPSRGRWLAWVAIGGAGTSLLQTIFGMFGNLLAYNLLPY